MELGLKEMSGVVSRGRHEETGLKAAVSKLGVGKKDLEKFIFGLIFVCS